VHRRRDAIKHLEASPPARIAQIEVGDAPEGLAVSPDGTFAAVGLLNGTWSTEPRGSVSPAYGRAETRTGIDVTFASREGKMPHVDDSP
jgi:hypothetical protein